MVLTNYSDDSVESEYFRSFDTNNKRFLDLDDFNRLTTSLLNLPAGALSESTAKELFVSFDCNEDNKIDALEFECVWKDWIKPLVQPVTALLVIDVQNDFIDGSLALKNCAAKQDGYEVIPIINEVMGKIKFDAMAFSLDQHPDDHISFIDNVKLYEYCEDNEKSVEEVKVFDVVSFCGTPRMEQILWPKHCVVNTWGAELHPELKVPEDSIMIPKGTNSKVDSYSAFSDNMKLSWTKLHEELKLRQVTHVFVCGLAYDFCVSFTALDALDLGYATVVIDDACRGTDLKTIESMQQKLTSNDCVLAPSSEIEDLVKAKCIKIEFAKTFAKHLRRKKIIGKN